MSTSITLNEIQDSLSACFDTLEGLFDEDTEARAQLEARFDTLVAAELHKVDGVSRMLAHFESQGALAAAEIKRLHARKKRMAAQYERLESCVRLALSISGKSSVEGETSTLTLAKNPAALLVSSAELVPDEYKITTVTTTVDIDNARLKADLKKGVRVSGAELVQGDRLVIR
jgi:hypothetical protein